MPRITTTNRIALAKSQNEFEFTVLVNRARISRDSGELESVVAVGFATGDKIEVRVGDRVVEELAGFASSRACAFVKSRGGCCYD
jgi:hypothetical protein